MSSQEQGNGDDEEEKRRFEDVSMHVRRRFGVRDFK